MGQSNAFNLDGGGSTTLAMIDPTTRVGSILNVSADSTLRRSVGSNLAVFAANVPEPASILLIAAGSSLVALVRRRPNRPV